MKSVIKKIAMFSMLVSTTGNTLLFTSEKPSHGENSSHESLNLMTPPTSDEDPVTATKIKVLNLDPNNFFIAAGALVKNNGKTNYSKQTPNPDGTYTFHSDHYYAAAENTRTKFENQHKGSDFIGKTTWNLADKKKFGITGEIRIDKIS